MGLCHSVPELEPGVCQIIKDVGHPTQSSAPLTQEAAAATDDVVKPVPACAQSAAIVPNAQQDDACRYFREVRLKPYTIQGEGGCYSFPGWLSAGAGAHRPIIFNLATRNTLTDDAAERLQRLVGQTADGLLKRLAFSCEHLVHSSSTVLQQESVGSKLPPSAALGVFHTLPDAPARHARPGLQWNSCPPIQTRQQVDHKDVAVCISGPCLPLYHQPTSRLAAENADVAAAISNMPLTNGHKLLACIDEMPEVIHGNLLQAIQGLPGRSQPRCPVHLLTYASEVARGVAALHRCGVHHGSLTPSAVLLVPSDQTPAATPPPPPPPSNPSDRRPVPPPLVVPGAPLSTAAKPAPGVLRCKLALYGLVHPVEHAGRLASNAAGWGALSYLAPECFTADPATVTQEMLTRMDAHAFGALCYHLFVGAAPYHQYHAAQVLVGLTAGGLQLTWPADLPPDGHRPAGQCRPPVPEPIRQLVSRCLDRNPEARPDFPEIVAILESIRRECEGQPS